MNKSIALATFVIVLLALYALYAMGYTLPVGGKEQVSINPQTGEKDHCPNAPALIKKRQLYNVYVIGRIDPHNEKILPPDRIIITQENLDKGKLSFTKFAWLSINSEIKGYLYTVVNQPEIDIGYRGRIWFYQNQEYRMVFHDIPSNWNCENYPNAEDYGMHYRPNGARYLLRIVWYDVDKQSVVDTYEQTIYVKYKEGAK